MLIKYVGPDAGVVAAYAGLTFPHGEAVEVPEKLARSLLEQSTFEAVKRPKPKTAAAASVNPNVEARSHGDRT